MSRLATLDRLPGVPIRAAVHYDYHRVAARTQRRRSLGDRYDLTPEDAAILSGLAARLSIRPGHRRGRGTLIHLYLGSLNI